MPLALLAGGAAGLCIGRGGAGPGVQGGVGNRSVEGVEEGIGMQRCATDGQLALRCVHARQQRRELRLVRCSGLQAAGAAKSPCPTQRRQRWGIVDQHAIDSFRGLRNARCVLRRSARLGFCPSAGSTI